MKKTYKNLIVFICTIVLTILLTIALGEMKVRDENLFLIFVIAILIILIEVKNIIYGIAASFIFVMFFNFFFTDPVYTFIVDDPNYYVSFIIFILVALIVGSLVVRLQKQNQISSSNEKRVKALYDVTSNFINIRSTDDIYHYFLQHLRKYFTEAFTVIDAQGNQYGPKVEVTDLISTAVKYAEEHNVICGKGEFKFKELNFKIIPLKSKNVVFGSLLIELVDNLTKDEMEFINNNVIHLIMALERENSNKDKERAKIQVEKEKFKTALLRSLSHDLKTPLTSIESGSNFILDSYDQLDDEEKKQILRDISTESDHLTTFIENLLNMTKLDDSKKILNKDNIIVDDILSDVFSKVRNKLDGKTLKIDQNEKVIMVPCNPQLLIQVLVNLIDNAVKHTKPDTSIELNYYEQDDFIFFEVIDDGGGISEDILPYIFDDFYSMTKKQDHKRSNGLGLGICKVIVESHGGKIKAFNNKLHGATFRFSIPLK